ncbi:MAG: globin domain-containing protein [Aggregatilineales bacterium]
MAKSAIFSTLFYERLFVIAPEAKSLFKTNIDVQGPKLMTMLITVVKGLDRLGELTVVLQRLAERHVGYGVKQEHYALADEALLWTLEKVWVQAIRRK